MCVCVCVCLRECGELLPESYLSGFVADAIGQGVESHPHK